MDRCKPMLCKRCPKTGRIVGVQNGWKWLFPLTGLLSLLWILFRVIPKPSRANYPCVRAAKPLAGGFLLWSAALLGSSAILHQAGRLLRRSGKSLITIASLLAVPCLAVVFLAQPHPVEAVVVAAESHVPVGTAQGYAPGRVVWVHDPSVTHWAGPGSGERWYRQIDQQAADAMLAAALQKYAGSGDDRTAWDKLFRFFNAKQGRNNVGYTPGERIVIKINLSTCSAYGKTCDAKCRKIAMIDSIDNSPQLLHALLAQLTRHADVPGKAITIGDPTGTFPSYLYNYLHQDFPAVHYWDNRGALGRKRAEFSNKRFYWSTETAQGKTPDYLPRDYVDATYLINTAVLKGHSSGISLCAKNHYGSLIRTPIGLVRGYTKPQPYYNLHNSLPNAEWSPGRAKYRALVDLMGHEDLGGKTLLYLVDGIFAGYYWDAKPKKWHMPPFNNDWPKSLFLSMDPVAIDSVGYDFIEAEWPDIVRYGSGKRTGSGLNGGAEDYLHEAAQANHPPSKTFYDPERDGKPMKSLGVHEHWNNPKDKRYSRNRGQSDGIELIPVELE